MKEQADPGATSTPVLYQQIENWLRSQIVAGKEGDPLPSEAELGATFGVSRMTARQAVQNLAAEGLVRRRRGSGTFIAPQPLHRHSGPLMSFTADMKRRGLVATSQLITTELRDATTPEVEHLSLGTRKRVVSIVRLRFAGGTPMALEHASLVPECAPVLAADLELGSLHRALRELGFVPMTALTKISARLATPQETRLLLLPARSPVLVERRLISDQNDTPIEWTTTVYDAERYVIDAVFTLYEQDPPPQAQLSASD